MTLRAVSIMLLFGTSIITGCNGCLKYKPKLTEAEVMSIADRAMADSGYDLTKTKPLGVRVNYIQDYCAWGVDYTLYGDRLPAGPLIFIDDRTRDAAFAPGM